MATSSDLVGPIHFGSETYRTVGGVPFFLVRHTLPPGRPGPSFASASPVPSAGLVGGPLRRQLPGAGHQLHRHTAPQRLGSRKPGPSEAEQIFFC